MLTHDLIKETAESKLDSADEKNLLPQSPPLLSTRLSHLFAQPAKPKTLVVALDFDHALAHNLITLRTLSSPEEKINQIIEDNKHLLKTLAAKIVMEGYHSTIIAIFTNRQSWLDDYNCGFVHPLTQGSGSCFSVYPEIAKQLQIAINDFKTALQSKEMIQSLGQDMVDRLVKNKCDVKYNTQILADEYNQDPGGTAILEAMKCNTSLTQGAKHFTLYENMLTNEKALSLFQSILTTHSNKKIDFKIFFGDSYSMQAPSFFDLTKITLVYAIIHRLSRYYTNTLMDVLFFDDNIPHILSSIANYYTEHHDLIPSNVSIQLHHYHTETAHSIALSKENAYKTITGTGSIDQDYKDNLLFWCAITLNIVKYDSHTASFLINDTDQKKSGAQIELSVIRRNVFRHFMRAPIGEMIPKEGLDYRHTEVKAIAFKLLRLQRFAAKLLEQSAMKAESLSAASKVIYGPK